MSKFMPDHQAQRETELVEAVAKVIDPKAFDHSPGMTRTRSGQVMTDADATLAKDQANEINRDRARQVAADVIAVVRAHVFDPE